MKEVHVYHSNTGHQMHELICKRDKRGWEFPSVHEPFWIEAFVDYGWHILTNDSWHVLFKHGKPKRIRKAK